MSKPKRQTAVERYFSPMTQTFCVKHLRYFTDVMFSDGFEFMCEECAREEYLKLTYVEKKNCQRPPQGWYCTRDAGHSGPCAAWPKGKEMGDSFKTELTALINKHGQEKFSNTPDFILAEYMNQCLLSFDAAVKARETWYGR